MFFPILIFARRPTYLCAENIQHGLTKAFSILRQMEEFIGLAKAHGVRLVPQMLDAVSKALLPKAFLGVMVGLGMLRSSSSLRIRSILQRLGAFVG